MENKILRISLVAVLAAGSAFGWGTSSKDSSSQVVNVKNFGAVGDGSTDDSLALQAAIDAAILDSGSIYIPKGVYKITNSLKINQTSRGLMMYGDGIDRTTIKQYDANDDAIIVISDHDSIVFKNMTIEGVYASRLSTGINITFSAAQLSQIFLNNVNIRYWDTCAKLDKIDQSNIIGCWFGGARVCLDIKNNVNALTINGCAFSNVDAQGTGLQIETPRGVTVNGCDFGGQGQQCIKLIGGQMAIDIAGNSFELLNPEVYAIYIDPKGRDGAKNSISVRANNFIHMSAEISANTKPVVYVNDSAVVTANVVFDNNIVQNYADSAPAVQYNNTDMPITGRVSYKAYNATDLKNSVRLGTAKDKAQQLGPFPVARQDAVRSETEETNGNITWFRHHSHITPYLGDDLQAVYAYYDDKGRVVYGRTSLFNDQIIQPLEKWKKVHPITESSSPDQVRSALVALQKAISDMPAYEGP